MNINRVGVWISTETSEMYHLKNAEVGSREKVWNIILVTENEQKESWTRK